jgi:hypothetical protein
MVILYMFIALNHIAISHVHFVCCYNSAQLKIKLKFIDITLVASLDATCSQYLLLISKGSNQIIVTIQTIMFSSKSHYYMKYNNKYI